MTSETTSRFSPEVRERAVRMVLEHGAQPPSRWATILSIAARIGCTGQTLNEWVKQAERDTGRRPGPTTDMAARLEALERENRELRQANEILREASAYFAQAEQAGPMQASLHGCPPTAGSSHDRLHRRSSPDVRG